MPESCQMPAAASQPPHPEPCAKRCSVGSATARAVLDPPAHGGRAASHRRSTGGRLDPCPPHTCSSARCCGGSWAPGRRSGWRPARPPWSPSARAERRHRHRADLLGVRPPLRARGGGGARPGQRDHATRCWSTTRSVWPVPSSGVPAERDPHPGRRRPGPAGQADLRLVPRDHPARHHPQAATGRAGRVRPAVDGRPGATPTAPDLLVLLGDQVYADVTSPTVRRLLRRRRRRPKGAPADQVVSFDEYTKLYLESWRDPEIRWLLSTVPSVMIFDDHEIIDDWNTSAAWRAEVREQPWWQERIGSGLASYWVYQHLGNLSPDEIAADPVFAKVAAAEDATERAARVRPPGRPGVRLAHDTEPARAVPVELRLDLGRTRLVMLDNRCSRVLEPGQPGDVAGRRVGLVPRPGARRLRPPGGRRVAALAAAAGHPPHRGVEREAGGLAPTVGGRAGRRSCAGPGPGALGGVPALLRRARRAVRPHRQRQPRQPARGSGPAGVRPTGVDQRALR